MYRLSVYFPCPETYIHKNREGHISNVGSQGCNHREWILSQCIGQTIFGGLFQPSPYWICPGRKPGFHVMLLSRWLLSQLDALSLPLGLLPPHFDLIKIQCLQNAYHCLTIIHSAEWDFQSPIAQINGCSLDIRQTSTAQLFVSSFYIHSPTQKMSWREAWVSQALTQAGTARDCKE